MRTKVLKTKDLSSTGFHLRPVYNRAGPPKSLHPDDRVFDPAIDKKAHHPVYIDDIRDRETFSERRNGKPVSVAMMVKPPQSHIHHFPEELAQFEEFFQTCINYEHNRSALPFVQAGFILISQDWVGPGGFWHHDVMMPSTHYITSDTAPTEFLFNHKLQVTPDVKAAFTAHAAGEQKLHSYEMNELFCAATGEDYFTAKTQKAFDIRYFDPYSISMHDGMTLHRGPNEQDRTVALLFYSDAAFVDDWSFVRHENPMKKMFHIRSAPMEEAPERLEKYVRRYGYGSG